MVSIVRIRDMSKGLELPQKSRYGLESCIFSRDFYKMWQAAKALQCGEVAINDLPHHGVGYFPFGGITNSGTGREAIGYRIEEMTNTKTICLQSGRGRFGKNGAGCCDLQQG